MSEETEEDFVSPDILDLLHMKEEQIGEDSEDAWLMQRGWE